MIGKIDILEFGFNPLKGIIDATTNAGKIAHIIFETFLKNEKTQGFHEGQKVYIAGCIQLLAKYKNGECLTIPHIIELLLYDWRAVKPLLEEYKCPASPIHILYAPDNPDDVQTVLFSNIIFDLQIKAYKRCDDFSTFLLTDRDDSDKTIIEIPTKWTVPHPLYTIPTLKLIKTFLMQDGKPFIETKAYRKNTPEEINTIRNNADKIREDIKELLRTRTSDENIYKIEKR